MSQRHAVILAGGKGERFWPLSTSKMPKQFLSLVGDKPLLAQAVDRLEGVVPAENIWVITNQDLVDVAQACAPNLKAAHIIGEPIGRDTAAAVALGAACVAAEDPKGVFCVLTADHIIADPEVFAQTLKDGLDYAEQHDALITIGIQPDEPSTGYGYIEGGEHVLSTDAGTDMYKAERFVEKPDRPTAEKYLEQGNYYWNSGMFMWSVTSIVRAFELYRPSLAELIDTMRPVVGKPEFAVTLRSEYDDLQKISIDYAVMEKSDRVMMIKGTFSWDDVGSWPALEHHFDADENGNIPVGNFRYVDATGNIVVSRDRMTALVGVKDLIVVQAEGVTLVCAKDQAQDIKKLVVKMREDDSCKELM